MDVSLNYNFICVVVSSGSGSGFNQRDRFMCRYISLGGSCYSDRIVCMCHDTLEMFKILGKFIDTLDNISKELLGQ